MPSSSLTYCIPTQCDPTLLLLASFAILIALSLLYLLHSTFLAPITRLRHIPAPFRTSYLLGNLPEIISLPPGIPHREWSLRFPGAFKYKRLFGEDRLVITDPVGLNHILVKDAYRFPKPQELRGNLSRILGKGLLFAEGEDHKRQKKIISPAFSPSALKALTPIFLEQANLLRDKWLEMIDTGESDDVEVGAKTIEQGLQGAETTTIVIDISKWLSRLTLDIIGLAGFGYSFDSLSGKRDDFAQAFQMMFSSSGGIKKRNPVRQLLMRRLVGTLTNLFPNFDVVTWIPSKRIKAVRKGFQAMEAATKKILKEKKKAIDESGVENFDGSKDLVTLLRQLPTCFEMRLDAFADESLNVAVAVKSNLGEAKSTLSDAELQGQMTTFILAGHETTSTVLSWLLYHLSSRPEIQARLRKEIREAKTEARSKDNRGELTADEIGCLTYLDAVCKEVLRFEPPGSMTVRCASENSLIPLSRPIIGANGEPISTIEVQKGQSIVISVSAVNFNPEVFGEDVEDFNPERWLKNEAVEGNVGVYSHMLTFLAGTRACIGYKFALLEVKTVITVLVDSFECAPRSLDTQIGRRTQLVTRPYVVGEERLGYRMPLKVSKAG